MVITALVTVVAAYLIGSISFAIIFAKSFLKKDVRELGSGNAGATNVLRNAGLVPGLLTFVCDALKGFAASYMGYAIFDYIHTQTGSEWSYAIYGAYLCGAACMLGHILPIFYEFKGGKGVATSVGIFAVCCPIAIVIGLSVFIFCVIFTKYVSLGSVLGAVTVVIFSIIFHNDTASILPQIILALIMGAMVIGKHRENIKRLLNGTESKVRLGGKKNG
ncbi:MAG: glycerol-3-phosphate 1-O-acyltransferase PlsY [Clostridia bacterium]|nr:glycerol-3-phosphate 1-O-acyltransferase PlsY [Clostridia bacterium]